MHKNARKLKILDKFRKTLQLFVIKNVAYLGDRIKPIGAYILKFQILKNVNWSLLICVAYKPYYVSVFK